jgi:hypothetical protein
VHEAAGGVDDVVDTVRIPPRPESVLEHRADELLDGGLTRVALDRDGRNGDAHRPSSAVLDRHLHLAVGPQPRVGTARPFEGDGRGDALSEEFRQGHQSRRLGRRISDHHALVADALIIQAAGLADRCADFWRLLRQREQDLRRAGRERLCRIVVAGGRDGLPNQAARSEWEAETAARERAEREYEEGLKKQRQREAEDFEYRKALERKKAQDKYDEETRLRDRKNGEKQEALEKSWQEREAALKAREDELTQLRKEADAFPKRLAQEIDRAVAEARRQGEQQFEQRILVATKDAEADKRVAELRIRTLEETAARQAEQVATLQKQLDEAKRQVQDIAVKAIEGASGAQALARVNTIAMEQARTRPTQG